MQINVLKNRGVLVSNPKEFGGLILSLGDCLDLEILDCRAKIKGLSGNTWARKWLYEGQRRPMKVLNLIPCPTSRKESAMTVKSLRKAFMASTSRARLKGEGHLFQEGLR